MPGDINIKLGSDVTLEQLQKTVKEIVTDVTKIREALKGLNMGSDKDAQAAAKYLNEMLKIEETVSKRIRQQKEESGVLGNLIKQQRDLRSAQKAATSQKELEQYTRQLKAVTSEIQNAKGATNTWGKALGSFQFKFNALGNIAANVVSRITAGLRNFIRASWDAALAISAVENAFKKLDRPDLLDDLRKATQGALSDLQLMQYAIRANNFRIPLKNLATFFEFATKRANETGESVDYLVESILIGLGRESVKILDNLGISAVQLQKEAEVLGSVGAAAVKIIKEELAGMGDVVISEATKIQSLSVTFQRIGTSLGKIFTEAFGESASKISKWIEWLATDFTNEFGKDSLEGFKKSFEDWENIPLEDKIKIMSAEVERFKQNIKETTSALAEFTPRSLEDIRLDPFKDVKANKIAKEILIQNQAQLKVYQEELAILERTNPVKTQELGILEKINEELDTLNLLRGKATTEDLVKQYTKEIEALEKYRQSLLDVNEVQRVVHDEGLQRIQSITDAQVTSDAKIQDSSLQVRKTQQETANPPEKLDPIKVAEDSLDVLSDLYGTWGKLIEANKQKELSAAGDNAKKREEIEKAYMKKQQRIAIGQAIMNTASGVIGIWKAYSVIPGGQIIAGIMTAVYVAKMLGEIAIIKAQKFGKGGLIEGQKHSQGGKLIEAEGGEFVTNARSTRKYRTLLDAINEDKGHNVWNALNLELNKKQIKSKIGTDYTKKLYEFIKNEMPHAYETQEYYVIERGSQTVKIHKN